MQVTTDDRRLTRRQILKTSAGIGGAVIAAPLLGACGGDGDSKTVLLGTFDDPLLEPLKQKILPMYKKETGITVKFLSEDFTTFFQKGLTDGQSKGGNYDIYLMDDGWVPQYAASEILVDLGKEGFPGSADFVPDWLELGYWPPRKGPRLKAFESAEPTLIGVPAIGDFETLSYRTDVLPQPPVSWTELAEAAKQHNDPSKKEYGFVFRGAAGNGVVAAWRNIALAYGAEYFDDNWNVVFNDSLGTQIGKLLVETLPSVSPPNVASFDSPQESASFLSGRALLAVQYSGNARLQNVRGETQVFGKTGHAIVPREKTAIAQSGIWVAGVSTSAPNRDNAIAFLKWFTSKRIQKEMGRARSTPVTLSAFDDAVAQKQDPWMPVAAKQVRLGLGSKPRTPDWSKVEDLLGTQLNEALRRGTLGDAMNVAAKQVTAFLERQGYFS
jgi:multiple sugar transport system substrate-binding protein